MLVALSGVYISGLNLTGIDPKIVPGDVAWMLTSTALVLLMTPGLAFFYGEYRTFLYHLLALVVVGIFTFGGSYLLYRLTDLIIPMRVEPKSERLGLDITQHDESYAFEYKTLGH